jgi:hypothetical protein
MLFSRKPTQVSNGETIFSSLALNLKTQESREDRVRKDLAHRLKHVCQDLSIAEFDALMLKMTREQLRGEGAVHGRPRPS